MARLSKESLCGSNTRLFSSEIGMCPMSILFKRENNRNVVAVVAVVAVVVVVVVEGKQ